MPVNQFLRADVFGSGAPTDTSRLQNLLNMQKGVPTTFASRSTPQMDGVGQNKDAIASGYVLLEDYLTKKEELSNNKAMQHPVFVEQKQVELHSRILELASIMSVELFLDSNIVDKIKARQSEMVDEALQQNEDTAEDMLSQYRVRRHQLYGLQFDPTAAYVDGGTLWNALQMAKNDIATAKQQVMASVDQQMLANEIDAIPSVIARYADVNSLMAWYSSALPIQKLALQKVGHQYIPSPEYLNPQDSKHAAYLKLLRTLERDQENIYNQIPEVQDAEMNLENAVQDCEAALKMVDVMRSVLTTPTPGVTSQGILSSRFGMDLDLLTWIVNNVKRPNPMMWDMAITPWEWIIGTNRPISFREKMDMRQPRIKYESVMDLDVTNIGGEEVTTEQTTIE